MVRVRGKSDSKNKSEKITKINYKKKQENLKVKIKYK